MAGSINRDELMLLLHGIMTTIVSFLGILAEIYYNPQCIEHVHGNYNARRTYSLVDKIANQLNHLHGLIEMDDITCMDHLRMNRNAFARLCFLLQEVGGLKSTRHVSVEVEVSMFLFILAHHEKNRIVKKAFFRSMRTVSKHFHRVLTAVLKLHSILIVRPTPIPEDSNDERWKHFKGCLGALDGTYIKVQVPVTVKPRFRNRKGDTAVNVLGVCDTNLNFIFMLTGWEGSAADSRVLRAAIGRPHGLKVPVGNYYLCDNGYTNCDGFLTPYRGVRYHLDEWGEGSARPQNKEEYFNMKHCRARNVIERAFGILKSRWAILRSCSFYPIRTHTRIIMACALLHNFIRRELDVDPFEELDEDEGRANVEGGCDFINTVDGNPEWNTWRDDLAATMFNQRRGST